MQAILPADPLSAGPAACKAACFFNPRSPSTSFSPISVRPLPGPDKTRTLLTALGIVFGVGSVIGMLAIGSGAREESLRFIEQLGVRNVLFVQSRPATS